MLNELSQLNNFKAISMIYQMRYRNKLQKNIGHKKKMFVKVFL